MTRGRGACIGAVLAGCASAPVPLPSVVVPDVASLWWLAGRWSVREDQGICHFEHWLAPASGSSSVFVVRGDGAEEAIARVQIGDISRQSDRELWLGDRHYRRQHDTLQIDTTRLSLTFSRHADITGSPCRRP